ncbi:hypothetical protein [Paraburkholderia sp. J8-2]|uniref:hypothetical protein n=1 Tax=Paraburkholderia sp. J8-2 TaxID=2805440 RepID=UPI002AB7DCE4|nr:hypothetical protein [Paraburkholderia sp. J8-2]
MVNTSSNRFAESVARVGKAPVVQAAVFCAVLLVSQAAMAQSSSSVNLSGLCIIPTILKGVLFIAAIAGVFIWAIAHMNSKNELADLTMKIGVPCVLGGAAVTIIAQLLTNSSTTCSGL